MRMKPLPWWSLADDENFVLRFDSSAEDETPVHGRPMGAVRSRTLELSDEVFEAVRCAWSDSDRCGTRSIRSAGETAHDAIAEARAELRAHAADAGAGAVVGVRCFAERKLPGIDTQRPAKLWCEGLALATDPVAVGPAVVPVTPLFTAPAPFAVTADAASAPIAAPIGEHDPAAPQDREPELPQARFTLVADAGIGMQGGKPIVSSTFGIRYRPIELGFYIVDLQRESVAPRDGGAVGLGLTVLGRKALRAHSPADAILGGSAIAAFQNGSTNPDIDGMYQAFAGLAYQSRWNLWHGQPWVQLRAGATTGTAVKNRVLPLLELHVGLATPERR
ncbi:MAG TPA: hypothetical protein VL326_13535 [Kofleriaceae bacterium]|nr:hypothetical protein [Kofleriaceae bacterium]